MSGQLRIVIDRLFALEENNGDFLRGNNKACALFVVAEGYDFESLVFHFDNLMQHLRWKNLGHILAGGNRNIGEIKGKSEIQKAFDFGQSIQ